MRLTLKFLPTLLMLALMVGAEACSDANAAPPTGDYRRIDQKTYFSKDVSVDGTFTAAGLDCTATRSWSGGTISLNASSNFAVNVGTGTSTGTVTLGGTGTQAIAIGDGAGAKTVTLGSATGASATTISGGTGDIAITSVDDLTLNGGSAGSIINIGTNVDGNVFHIGDNDTAADTGTIGSAKDTWALAGISVTAGSTGTTSALVLQSGTGDVNITSADDINIGAAAVANDIVVGNATGATSLGLIAGTAGITVTSAKNKGTCTLNAASPSVCPAQTTVSGLTCVASIVGTTAAIAAKGVAVSLSGATLTITSANGAGETVNWMCF